MRRRLIAATIDSLVDSGYTRTTTVEVCKRAGVTRGALAHHFASPSQLFAEALKYLYADLAAPGPPPPVDDARRPRVLADWIDRVWAVVGKREFKAVIELWLAARNDPDVRGAIVRVVREFEPVFSPEHARSAFGASTPRRSLATFYRVVIEALIGLSLGRAVTPKQDRGHVEDAVLTLLKRFAAEV